MGVLGDVAAGPAGPILTVAAVEEVEQVVFDDELVRDDEEAIIPGAARVKCSPSRPTANLMSAQYAP